MTELLKQLKNIADNKHADDAHQRQLREVTERAALLEKCTAEIAAAVSTERLRKAAAEGKYEEIVLVRQPSDTDECYAINKIWPDLQKRFAEYNPHFEWSGMFHSKCIITVNWRDPK